ncbi:membrane protein (plasmid) [Fulvitalea axinellae]|uniref:Membrane protein n=1 Tax=Fulvitalea axinellae TaxID=1182444 RepID=A0AAU9CJD9_9BACT|nr:membrane protein [Fulvitalea axinellae]
MKSSLKYILAASIAFGSFSCSDFLEEEPQSFLSPSVVKTSSDADLMVAGILSIYSGNNHYSRDYYLLSEISSDHASTVSGSSSRIAIDHYNYDTNHSDIEDVWESGVRIVANANYLIAGMKDGGNAMSEDDKANYDATARFFRAHTYFDLVRLFGGVALLREPVESAAQLEGLKRNSVQEVYDFITSELEAIEGQFTDSWNSSKRGTSFPTKWAVKALLSNVYLTQAGKPLEDASAWAKSATKAKELLDEGGYGFIEGGYAELFKVENKTSNEHIWSILSHRTIHAVNCRFGGIGTQDGWGNFGVTEGVMDIFDDADPRKAATFMTEIWDVNSSGEQVKLVTMDEWSYQGVPMIAKFAAPENTGVPAKNWKDDSRRKGNILSGYRYGEMLLVYAEAENEANPGSSAALQALNKVRDRVGMPAITATDQAGIREAIKMERTYEMAFEARRRFDLVRWGDFMTAMKKDPEAKDFVQSHHTLFPIPQREYDVLKDFEQNPGYPSDRSGSN